MTRNLIKMFLAAIAALQWLQPPVLAADHRDAPTMRPISTTSSCSETPPTRQSW